MTPLAATERYKNHHFPAEIISHGVWLYYRFTLSYCDVEELLFERGVAYLTKLSANGVGNLGKITRIGSGADGLSPGTNGISMRCF